MIKATIVGSAQRFCRRAALGFSRRATLGFSRRATLRFSRRATLRFYRRATLVLAGAAFLAAGCAGQAVFSQEKDLPPPRRSAPPPSEKPRGTDRAEKPRGADRAEKPRGADRAEKPTDRAEKPRDKLRGVSGGGIRNGERAEKLRDFGGRLFEALAGDPSLQPKPLDVPKLNEGIVALLKPLFENEQMIESFKLGFDPEATNFAKDSAKLIASTRLKKSAWSPDPSQLDMSVTARFLRGEKGAPQARLEGQLELATDVVPLANHAVAKFLERSDPARSRGGRRSDDDPFLSQVRERLSKTPPMTSMDELVDVVVGLTALRFATMNDRIVELAAELGAESDAAAQRRLAAELAQARLDRDHLFDVRPRVERDSSGQAAAVHFTLDRSAVPGEAQLDRLAVSITAERITVDVGGMFVQGMEAYGLLKPLVTNTLLRVQDRDPDTLKLGQGILDGFLRQNRDTVLEESE